MHQLYFELLLVSPFLVLAFFIFVWSVPRRGLDKFSYERRKLSLHKEKDELR